MATRDVRPRDEAVDRLLDQFDTLDRDLQDLLAVQTPDEAHARVLAAVARLTEATAARLYRWDLDARAHVAGPSHGAVPEADPQAAHRETIEWALEQKSVVQIPGERDATVWVIPLVGLQVRVGFVLCWAPRATTALMTDLLNRAAQRISGYLEHLTMRFETGKLRDLFDNIIECIPHAIIAVDLKERVIEMNSNSEFIFGIRRFEVLDEPMEAGFPAPLVQAFRTLALDALRSRISRDMEVEHRLDEKTQVTLGVSASALVDRQGTPRGVVYLCRDLRATRELERLRELDRMKNEFVHMISHELKTPLTAITGGVQLMAMGADELTQDQKELLDLIDQGSKRLQTLVQDILAIARLESGRIQLEREPHDLSKTIAVVIKGLAVPDRIKLKRAVMAKPPKLKYDENKVRDILENFLSNAIKYSPEGGTVSVSLQPDGKRLVFYVQDEGIGIPENELPKVFDKFHRCENAATSGIEGTGLGLAITKHLIELHGWEVGVASTLGKGTRFTITMPIPRPEDLTDDAA